MIRTWWRHQENFLPREIRNRKQNLPREENIRGVYIAPPGHFLVSIDYSQLELCSLAQHCLTNFGQSKMADLINSDVDLHLWFGKELLKADGMDPNNCSKKKIKEYRQIAKACSFGYPGGLGPDTFINFSRGYGLKVERDKAEKLKQVWLETFPEMKYHLKPKLDTLWTERNINKFLKKHLKTFKNKKSALNVSSISEMEWFLEKEGWPASDISSAKFIVQAYMASTVTGRVKRNCTFCASSNYPFQGLASDGAKMALWAIYDAGYKIVNFIHDKSFLKLYTLM